MSFSQQSLWSRFRAIGWPFFTSESRGRALAGIVTLVVLLLGINALNFVNSYVGRDFMSALVELHPTRFYILAGQLVAVFAASTVVEVLARYTEQRLGLVWREWLTSHLLDRYLANNAFYRLLAHNEIDNPDQRITEDVKTLTSTALSFLVLLVNAFLTFLTFAGVLWSITPWLFLTAILYATAGSLGTIVLGRRLVRLDNSQLQREADFRFGLSRLRDHAAPVAQQGGQPLEKASLIERLRAVVDNFTAIIRVNRNLGFFTTGYNYLPQIIPAALVAPMYIRGEIEFGTVTQSAMAFTQVLGAFSLIVTQFQQVSVFAAVVGRLGSLWDATEPPVPAVAGAVALVEPAGAAPTPLPEPAPAPLLETITDSQRVIYEGLTLWTPGEHRLLVQDLSLEVPAGRRLIVTGPPGAGKTALCLATAGLWPEGRGHVLCPDLGRLMFLPEHLYTAPGHLRDVLLYGIDRQRVTDERIRHVLNEVGLQRLQRLSGGLDAEADWALVLSTSEQYALALARLLLARPRFAFLDGVPWSLELAWLDRFYAALARNAISYISVGEQTGLVPYHDLWLELQGDGRWRLRWTGAVSGRHPSYT